MGTERAGIESKLATSTQQTHAGSPLCCGLDAEKRACKTITGGVCGHTRATAEREDAKKALKTQNPNVNYLGLS